MPTSGRIDGRVFTTEPDLNVNKSNAVSLELLIVVLLRSTNQRIQPDLTPDQETASQPPACVHYTYLHVVIQAIFDPLYH